MAAQINRMRQMASTRRPEAGLFRVMRLGARGRRRRPNLDTYDAPALVREQYGGRGRVKTVARTYARTHAQREVILMQAMLKRFIPVMVRCGANISAKTIRRTPKVLDACLCTANI